ncbi:MAG: hypothetical protein M3373_07895 [Gemmatimonadota bacterium]|nr:hypothetical protein [Gemmatimonadota bacterium]
MRHTRVLWATAALFVTLHALIAWHTRVPSITTGNDDALYLLLARSLRALTYRDLWDAATPWHSQYPPLYPALLAVTGALAGDRMDVHLAVNILLSAGALLVFFDAARRVAPWPGLLALATAALNPSLLRAAGAIASEPLFLFLVALTLRMLIVGAPSVRTRAGAAASAIGGSLARGAGVTLVGAVGLLWLLERRWRDAVVLAAVAALTAGPWLIWTAIAPDQVAGRSYVADALFFDPAERELPPAAAPEGERRAVEEGPAPGLLPGGRVEEELSDAASPGVGGAHSGVVWLIAQRIAHNVPAYLARRLPTLLAVPTRAGTIVDNLTWLAVLAVCGGAGLWLLARKWRVAVLWLACYALLLAVWPYSHARFLVPALPWIVFAIAAGAALLGARWHRALALALPLLVVAPSIAGAVAKDAAAVRAAARCDRAQPFISPGCFDEHERAFFVAVAFARDSLPPDAIVLTAKEGPFYYVSGRRTVQLLGAVGLKSDSLGRYLAGKRASYVLLSHIKLDEWALRGPLIELCPRLEVVRAWEPAAVLLRVLPEPRNDPAATATCTAAVQRWAAVPW